MTQLRDVLQRKAKIITASWNFGPHDVTFQGAPYDHLEMVLHELAHAVSLGIPLDSGTPKAVSRAIAKMQHGKTKDGREVDSLFGYHSEAALREEARAWAIEWELLQELELPYDWDSVVDGAAVQGVEEDLLEECTGTAEAKALAQKALQTLNAYIP